MRGNRLEEVILISNISVFICLLILLPGIEPKASFMLGKYSTTELQLQMPVIFKGKM
jgi:hypothetical protein